MELEFEFDQISRQEGQEQQARGQEDQVARLKRAIESMQKVLKSVKETQQRNYLRRLQDMEKQLNDSNALSEKLQALAR
jgi:hypothetical protein